MKKLCCLLISFALVFCLCACSVADRTDTPDEPEATPAPTQDLSLYEADEGKLAKEISYNANGLRFRTVIYEYDDMGMLAKETTLGINDAPESRKEYERNAKGLVTCVVNFTADGPEEYSEQFRVLYEYNEMGLRMKELTMVGGTVTSEIHCAYIGENLVSEKYYEGTELLNEKSYEYNDAGKVTKCTVSDYIEGGSFVELSTYDELGRLVKCERSTDGADSGRTEYAYDENGSVSCVSIYGSDGSTLSITQSVCEYDKPGNIVKRTDTQEGSDTGTVTEYIWEYVKG